MPVKVASSQIRTSGRVMVFLFPSFLDRSLRYQIDAIVPGSPVAQEWHQHEGEEVLIPLRGGFRLEYRDGDTSPVQAISAGARLTVPPGVAHRLVTSGGLVESFRSAETEGTAGEPWIDGEEGRTRDGSATD